MNQKQITIFTLMLLLTAGWYVMVSPQSVSAHGRFGGRRSGAIVGDRHMMGRADFGGGMGMHGMMGMHLGQELNLTIEQRRQLREHHQEWMSEHHKEMEEFVGLSHEEMRERVRQGDSIGDILREQGKTPAELEQFLQKETSDRLEHISRVVDLAPETRMNIQQRVSEMIKQVAERLFD